MIFQVCTSNSFLPVMIPRFLVNLNELAFIFGSLSFPPLSEIICPLSLKKSVISIASKSFSISSGLDSTTTNSIGSGESIRRETNIILGSSTSVIGFFLLAHESCDLSPDGKKITVVTKIQKMAPIFNQDGQSCHFE